MKPRIMSAVAQLLHSLALGRTLALWSVALLALGCVAGPLLERPARAQVPPDPFGGAGAAQPAGQPFAPGGRPAGAALPGAGAGAAAPGVPAAPTAGAAEQPAAAPQAESLPQAPEDRAAMAILETNPQTPEELARAAKILADLNRPQLARGLLARLLAARPDEKQLADLAGRFGTDMFLEMASRVELHPEAQQVCDAVMDAYTRRLEAPERIARLIAELSDADPEVRFRALAGLQEARGAAVGPMIQGLADPARSAEHPYIRAALARFGSDAVGPLVGLLERSEPQVQAQVLQVLAAMNARQTAVYMLGPCASARSAPEVRRAAAWALERLVGHVPTKAEAVALLVDRAEEYFNEGRVPAGEFDGKVMIWGYDPQRKISVSRTWPVDLAACQLAARLARDAYALAPEVPGVRTLYLATMLECAAWERGWQQVAGRKDDPAGREAAGLGVRAVEETLGYALAHDHPGCAAAAAGLLGRIGTAEELLHQGPSPSVLAVALWHKDRRVRLAAAQAVVSLAPAQGYPGASYLPKSLRFFVATTTRRRAIVAAPRVDTARELAGLLAAVGLQTDTATSGRELLRLALECPDYELALIDPAIENPRVELLLQQLRRDPRSADLRVGLIAREGFFELADDVAREDVLTLAFARPHTKEVLQWQLDRLAELAPRRFVPAAQRQQQAVEALKLLAVLSSSPQQIYDLRQVEPAVLLVLELPELGVPAAQVAGNLGTPEAQQALVEAASRFSLPIQIRRAAAAAFAHSTKEHGILLTSEQILRQYDRYNRSADQDRSTQQVLARILDAIEARARLGPPAGTAGSGGHEQQRPEDKPQAAGQSALPPGRVFQAG